MTSLDEMRRELRERYERLSGNPVERRLPLDGDVWRAIRKQGLGLDSVGASWVYEDGVGYVLLKFKPGIKEEYIQRVASAVRELGYNVRIRRGVVRRNPLEEHKVRDPEAVKRYTLWIEKLEKVGLRDPEDPFKIIPPGDPRTRREIERLKIELAYAKGEIDLDEYHKRHERLSRNLEFKENLKSDDWKVYLSWRDEKCGITKEHKKVLERWKMLQNQFLEPLPKELQGTYHPAIEIGLAMENAMDVARELSKYPYSHMPYIEEKIRFINNRLEELVKTGCL